MFFTIRYMCLLSILLLNCLLISVKAQYDDCDRFQVSVPNVTVISKTDLLVTGDDYIDIKVNHALRLKCEGSEPVVWILPNSQPTVQGLIPMYGSSIFPTNPPEFVKIETIIVGNRHISQLTIDETVVEDVGYYSCHYNTSLVKYSHRLVHNKTNSIYVFVTDPHNLFVGHLVLYPILPAINNSALVIPCRPSSSLSEVTLWTPPNDHFSGIYNIMPVNDSTGVSYDPKTGFHVKLIHRERYRCMAKLNNTTVSLLNITLHFVCGITHDPLLEESSVRYVFVGDNYTIKCSIRVSDSCLTDLKWNLNDVCTQDWRDRLTANQYKDLITFGIIELTDEITITNATHTDWGIYTCEAHDLAGNIQKVSKLIKIYDAPKLEIQSHSMGEIICGDRLTLYVNLESVPNDINAVDIKWFKNGELITNSSSARISRDTPELATITLTNIKESDSGNYTIEANLLNILYQNTTIDLVIYCDNTPFLTILLIIITGTCFLALAFIIGNKIRLYRREKRELEYLSYNLFSRGQIDLINPDLPLDEQIDLLPYDSRCEFPIDNLEFGQILGQGAFGRVIRAEAIGILELTDGGNGNQKKTTKSTTVAVKTLKECADMGQRKALLAELKILIHIGKHINIVNLLGAVTKNLVKGELLVIVEYCKFGNIRSFLLSHRMCFVDQLDKESDIIDNTIISNEQRLSDSTDNYRNSVYPNASHEYKNVISFNEMGLVVGNNVTTSDLISYAFQCAKGMEYLSSKRLIHRDLAARNVLLTGQHIVKICDFGLARDCYGYDSYVKKGDGPLPIKWMAIESMRDKVYNEKSDVWSFGVFMWEIFTLGSNPYPGFEIDEHFYKRLVDGYRMERPDYSPLKIYTLMKNCWEFEPKGRPDFTSLSNDLKQMMSEIHLKIYENLVQSYSSDSNCEDSERMDEYLPMGENNQNFGAINVQTVGDSYVDMSSSGEKAVTVKFMTTVVNNCNYNDTNIFTNDNANNGFVSPIEDSSYEYDDVKNVRSIYVNTPMPKEPMEWVPMIQL
ncbi:vascular endothelial growth factor receptor 2-like [Oppia nitens]|uniref:vascular endothelial growth factor receptor 2-like n=1 Tax=Oppia nitens TaxID=1686743 RepID=UPI0023DB6FBE|nr:vascular endothelial growth factor receptor 2-like [Oppia nitens]